jgi:hypothetical protein
LCEPPDNDVSHANTPHGAFDVRAAAAHGVRVHARGPKGEEIKLQLRTQIQPFHATGPWVEAHFESAIVPSQTAIVITDMWDKHWCKGATHRVRLIAQRMEPLLAVARSAGILIVHAPSNSGTSTRCCSWGCMQHVHSQPELWSASAVKVGTALRVGARSYRCHV